MKKMMKAAGLGLVILSSSLVATAANAAQKIGYLNTAMVFQNLPQREVIAKKLHDEFKDKTDELDAIKAKAQKKIEKLKRNAALMTDADKNALTQEIRDLESDYKDKGRALEKASSRREAEERQKLLQKIDKATKVIAKKDGYDLIVDVHTLVYAKPDYDISKAVIAEIAKEK